MKSHVLSQKADLFVSILFITVGALFAAISLETVLIPNGILDGGATGISIILSQITACPLWLLVIIFNIPLVFVGYKNLGKIFLIKAIFSMLIFALFLFLLQDAANLTSDRIISIAFGGVLLGMGVGLVIRFGSCLDGTESVAIVVNKKTSLSVGQVVLLFNICIFGVAGLIFGIDRAMYSLITYFITFKTIDFVSEGLDQAKAALIVTNHETAMGEAIYKRLGRTVTKIEGEGLLTGKKTILYCVITRIEIQQLRRIVEEEDGEAFITISDVSDVIGNHIKSLPKKE